MEYSGFNDKISPQMAEAIGALNEVPLTSLYFPPTAVLKISTPGAARSSDGP